MTAIELAADIESVGAYSDVAAMLRAQHAAIRTLREALEDTAQTLVWAQWGDCRKFSEVEVLWTGDEWGHFVFARAIEAAFIAKNGWAG
jgi:hypothetical protein